MLNSVAQTGLHHTSHQSRAHPNTTQLDRDLPCLVYLLRLPPLVQFNSSLQALHTDHLNDPKMSQIEPSLQYV